MIDPIRIRIRHSEATAAARRLLRELDEKAIVQRRVKLQASKALLAVSEVRAAVESQLKGMSTYARAQLTLELRTIEARLLEISKRGRL